MKRKIYNNIPIAEVFLIIMLLLTSTLLVGCGKVAIKDPVFLPGVAESNCKQIADAPAPIFTNGDIVCLKMNTNKKGIVMQSNYKYIPKLNAWYCVVDFYPSSALLHFDFSKFDNYERRYVYEYELELLQSYQRQAHTVPPQWQFMQIEVVQ